MKVRDLVLVVVALFVLFLQFSILNNWGEINGTILTLMAIISIFGFLFVVGTTLRYYLMNSEVETLLNESWFQKAVLGYSGYVILLKLILLL